RPSTVTLRPNALKASPSAHPDDAQRDCAKHPKAHFCRALKQNLHRLAQQNECFLALACNHCQLSSLLANNVASAVARISVPQAAQQSLAREPAIKSQ